MGIPYPQGWGYRYSTMRGNVASKMAHRWVGIGTVPKTVLTSVDEGFDTPPPNQFYHRRRNEMSVRWDSFNTAAYDAAKEHGAESDEWKNFSAMRDSVIYAMLVVGFPAKSEWKITNSNWKEIYARLHMYERGTYAWRTASTDSGRFEPVYFTPDEIKSLVGLEVNAGNKTDAQFTKTLMTAMRQNASDAVSKANNARLHNHAA